MNWSLIDNYIVNMGKGDTYENAALLHTIKCTTCRLMLLPAGHEKTNKTIMDSDETRTVCDIYVKDTAADGLKVLDGFIR